MANYRNISVNFWSDSKVDDEFTPEDKYFYLYLLTNPHTNICGCYEISMKQMERETGYNTDTVKRLIARMQEVHGVIRYCKDTREILVLNWYRYNWSKSENVRKAVSGVLEHIKNTAFKIYVIDRVSIWYGYHIEPSVTDTVTDTVTVTDTETVTETVSEYRDSNIYADFEAEFETIWKAYPRKEGKTNALKAYIKARTDKEPVSFETVQEGVMRYIEYIKANNTEQRYIKHGSTWFNQRCWDDDYTIADNSNRPEGYEIIKQEPNDYDGITYHYANGIVRVFDDSKMMIKEYRE